MTWEQLTLPVYLVFLCALNWTNLRAHEVSLEVTSTRTNFNRFSIPSEQNQRITTPTHDSITGHRVSANFDLSKDHMIYFLYAPLEVQYETSFSQNQRFNNTDFAPNTQTQINYKFNSYRVGYFWKYDFTQLKTWIGATLKVRDAKIELVQGAQKDSFSNLGLVPLASFGFQWSITPTLSLYHHTDALGAPQGSAYDSSLELRLMTLSHIFISLGKRILGGGADNESVYNFAQFDSYFFKITLSL